MRWDVALRLARECGDVTEEEWCGMYVRAQEPEPTQIEKALKVAEPILKRNRMIAQWAVVRPDGVYPTYSPGMT